MSFDSFQLDTCNDMIRQFADIGPITYIAIISKIAIDGKKDTAKRKNWGAVPYFPDIHSSYNDSIFSAGSFCR